uniref:Uncharacterized protein n=1 Tax=Anguilla anguilla TaxID=7936 RepID=A0A0E9QTW8_ANGAN
MTAVQRVSFHNPTVQTQISRTPFWS